MRKQLSLPAVTLGWPSGSKLSVPSCLLRLDLKNMSGDMNSHLIAPLSKNTMVFSTERYERKARNLYSCVQVTIGNVFITNSI